MLRSSRARLELLRLEGLVPRLGQSWQPRGEEMEQQLAGAGRQRRSRGQKEFSSQMSSAPSPGAKSSFP